MGGILLLLLGYTVCIKLEDPHDNFFLDGVLLFFIKQFSEFLLAATPIMELFSPIRREGGILPSRNVAHYTSLYDFPLYSAN